MPSVVATLEGWLGWWWVDHVAAQSRPDLMICRLLGHVPYLVLDLIPLFVTYLYTGLEIPFAHTQLLYRCSDPVSVSCCGL
jgi:hypothetical protein